MNNFSDRLNKNFGFLRDRDLTNYIYKYSDDPNEQHKIESVIKSHLGGKKFESKAELRAAIKQLPESTKKQIIKDLGGKVPSTLKRLLGATAGIAAAAGGAYLANKGIKSYKWNKYKKANHIKDIHGEGKDAVIEVDPVSASTEYNFSDDQKWDIWLRVEDYGIGIRNHSKFKKVAKDITGNKRDIKKAYFKKYYDFPVKSVGLRASIVGSAIGGAIAGGLSSSMGKSILERTSLRNKVDQSPKGYRRSALIGAGAGALGGLAVGNLTRSMLNRKGLAKGNLPVKERSLIARDIRVLPAGSPCPGKEVK